MSLEYKAHCSIIQATSERAIALISVDDERVNMSLHVCTQIIRDGNAVLYVRKYEAIEKLNGIRRSEKSLALFFIF